MSSIPSKYNKNVLIPSPLVRGVERPPYTRRNFLRTTGLTAVAGLIGVETVFAALKKNSSSYSGKGLKLSFVPFDLQLRHTFTLANSSRNNTPDILTKLEFEGITGYGEASMPPYLGESVKTASRFLASLNLSQFNDPFQMEDILHYVDSVVPGNCAAKASVDIALHDLVGKLMGQPWYKIWGFDPADTPNTSFTIGIDTPEVVRQKSS